MAPIPTAAEWAARVVHIRPGQVVAGHIVVDILGTPHVIERVDVTSGPLVDAGLAPAERIAVAVDGWSTTLRGQWVPVLGGIH